MQTGCDERSQAFQLRQLMATTITLPHSHFQFFQACIPGVERRQKGKVDETSEVAKGIVLFRAGSPEMGSLDHCLAQRSSQCSLFSRD